MLCAINVMFTSNAGLSAAGAYIITRGFVDQGKYSENHMHGFWVGDRPIRLSCRVINATLGVIP